MDEKYAAAREQFFAAVRALATSSDSIQARLLEATTSISLVTLDEFDGDIELRIKLARILDHIGPDHDDIERVAIEITPYMTEHEAEKVADLIVDFFDELVGARSKPRLVCDGKGGEMAKEPLEFSASANGDKWYLEYENETAEPTVIHRANAASGGADTKWSVASFLQVVGDHPQGQALREALAKARPLQTEADSDPSIAKRNAETVYPWTPKTKVGDD